MSDNWNETNICLGNIKAKNTYKFSYHAKKQLDILSVEPSCSSCTTVLEFSPTHITIKFKASDIPKHLDTRFINSYKTITVKYKDGTEEVLSFTAKIYGK